MATSSIHIETSSAGALIHNERVFSPDYLISNDKNINEYNSYTDIHISELEKLAKIDYQKHSINNRKLPKNATLIKEAIINLNENHTLQDLEKVKQTLENEYGYKISNMSIHKDEGYIYTDTKNYTMGRNQFKNLEDTPHIAELDLKDNKFYEWNLSNNKWVKGDEIKDYKIEKNYHAHVVMLNYDFLKHRTIRNNLKDLSKMQTLVANDLKMQRGKCSSYVEAKKLGVEVQQSRKRLNIQEHKIQKRKENELKKEIKELKKEIYNFREMQKSITAMELTTDEKKELHSLNSKVKNQTATIEELNKKINELTEKNKEIFHPTLKKSDDTPATNLEVANHYIKQNKSLQEQKKVLENKVTTLEEKINSSANMSDYEAIKKENESLKKENSFLKRMVDKVLIYANSKIRDLINFGKPQVKQSVSFEDFESQIAVEDMASKASAYSKMNLEDILKSNPNTLKEAQDNLKELLEKDQQETAAVNIRKIF